MEEKEHMPGCYDHDEEGNCICDEALMKKAMQEELWDYKYHLWKERIK